MFTTTKSCAPRLHLTEGRAVSSRIDEFVNPMNWYAKQPQHQKASIT